MSKKSWLTLAILALLFLFLFDLRVFQIGGLKPNLYKFSSFTLEEPDSYSVQIRQALSDKITQLLPSPQAQLLNGIMLGQKSDLPQDLKNNLVKTSTVHIVVVSGQNLSLLAGFIFVLVPFLGRRKTIILTSIVIWGFSALTGFQLPVLRAAIMAELTYLAQLLGKDREGYWVLIMTAALMLLIDPNWLFSVSFQLSFMATAGVVILSPQLEKKLYLLPDLIKQDLAVTLAAQLLTLPIIASNFHQLSLVGILANAFILWTIGPIMILGFITLCLGFLSFGLAQLFGLIPNVLLTYFVDVINFFSSLPFASINLDQTSGEIWIGYYLLILACFLLLQKSQKEDLNVGSVLNLNLED